MTWGVSNPNPEKPSAKRDTVFAIATAGYAVPVSGNYTSFPSKEVFHSSITLLVFSSLAVFLGIGHLILAVGLMQDEDMYHFATGYPIWTGVFFIIAGAVGLASCRRRSRGKLIATAVLSCFTVFFALVALIHTLRSLFLYQSYDDPSFYDPPPDEEPDLPTIPPNLPRSREGFKIWLHWLRLNGTDTWSLRIYIRRFFFHHRQKRMSIEVQQMEEDPAYFATTICLLVAFVVIAFSAINLAIQVITTLKKGRGNVQDVRNGHATQMKGANSDAAKPMAKKYMGVSIVVAVLGVLVCFLGIGQTWAIKVYDNSLQSGINFGELCFLKSAYCVWNSVVFILSAIYGIRACMDGNQRSWSALLWPIFSILDAGSIFGYTIRTLFYPRWDIGMGNWGRLYDSDLYLGLATCVIVITAAIFVCGVLQIYFTVRMVKIRKKSAGDGASKHGRMITNLYKLDLSNGNAD